MKQSERCIDEGFSSPYSFYEEDFMYCHTRPRNIIHTLQNAHYHKLPLKFFKIHHPYELWTQFPSALKNIQTKILKSLYKWRAILGIREKTKQGSGRGWGTWGFTSFVSVNVIFIFFHEWQCVRLGISFMSPKSMTNIIICSFPIFLIRCPNPTYCFYLPNKGIKFCYLVHVLKRSFMDDILHAI